MLSICIHLYVDEAGLIFDYKHFVNGHFNVNVKTSNFALNDTKLFYSLIHFYVRCHFDVALEIYPFLLDSCEKKLHKAKVLQNEKCTKLIKSEVNLVHEILNQDSF